ncbi:toxin biosynthesis proten [Grosmannia clavigera kw1407]|uniref:Toxin biosynthesis proten n=1 Tax=Grosmannia clavigera (strain kw1407 / UAMH 11150) TaxID=655863 RepID=F0XB50_GROCL|nr:toxin biosynthesis protein [Grosmannia clavigera kw1407]EFX04937.1 toxin biosynthesis proten [Grosmannia clavigera kw1407]
MPSAISKVELQRVKADVGVERILEIVREDGGVIIKGFLTPEQVRDFNSELEPAMAQVVPGSMYKDNQFISDFHGNETKRLTNLVTHSKTFREQILDMDLVHDLATTVFEEESGSYWMTTAQVIEIGPGNKAQILHRDLENTRPYVDMGPNGPEAMINFLIALSDFTEANGATRVIPKSNHWPDFNDRGTLDQTIPAEMDAGDVLFICGKVVHGGGANVTADRRRRGLAFTFQPSFLTPEEAYPFLVDLKTVKQMSTRAQRMIGFRSQFPKGSPGLWQSDYKEIADYIGL